MHVALSCVDQMPGVGCGIPLRQRTVKEDCARKLYQKRKYTLNEYIFIITLFLLSLQFLLSLHSSHVCLFICF